MNNANCMNKIIKSKKPTKKEIKRMADLLVSYQNDPDQNHEFLYRLYLALNTKTHKKAAVETILAEAFNLKPF
jgi:hypothetical protein